MQAYRPQHLLPEMNNLITEEADAEMDAVWEDVRESLDVELVVSDEDPKELCRVAGDRLLHNYMQAWRVCESRLRTH